MALERLGYGRKDERTSIPPMPADLVRHFVRGYFDGDGGLSVYVQKVKQWTVNKQEWSLTGHPELLTQIQAVLESETTVSRNVTPKTYRRTTKAVSLRYGRKADIPALHAYLYDGATVYLRSKHAKFLEFFARS